MLFVFIVTLVNDIILEPDFRLWASQIKLICALSYSLDEFLYFSCIRINKLNINAELFFAPTSFGGKFAKLLNKKVPSKLIRMSKKIKSRKHSKIHQFLYDHQQLLYNY